MRTATAEEYDPLLDGGVVGSHYGTMLKLTVFLVSSVFLVSTAAVVMSTLDYVHITDLSNTLKVSTTLTESTCSVDAYKINYTPFYGSPRNSSRFSVSPGSALLKNVTIWTVNAADQELREYDVLILDGVITQIGPNLPIPGGFPADKVYRLNGAYMTPGLVDIHSHLGVYSYPDDAAANDDGNEYPVNPLYPQLRALDSINPSDPAIGFILGGGVTTSLVLPGSANIMGGEAAYVKLRGQSLKELLIPSTPRAFKMACGENPKRNYGAIRESPTTRMGAGWLFRRIFYDAAVLNAQQKQWDCLSSEQKQFTYKPQNLELEPLISILNKESKLMVHCYKVEDFEMILRSSDEFNFTVTTFHHGLEAWKLRHELARRNISVATWPDSWGFKIEGYDGSVHAPRLLLEAGVPLILKTDHPVVYAKYFMYEVGKAVHFGITWQQALRAATQTPAQAMGISDRVGSIEVSKDGDVVIWDRYPLALGAVPSHVFVEGNLLISRPISGPATPTPERPVTSGGATLNFTGETACQNPSHPYIIRGVTAYTMDDNDSVFTNATAVVENGILLCLQSYPGCEGALNPNITYNTYKAEGGWLIPGLINVGSITGQSEVDSEVNSQDGVAAGVSSGATAASIKAIDGVRLNNYLNRHVTAALNGSVTTVHVSPQGTRLVKGQSGLIYLIPASLIENALVTPNTTSLDFAIGSPRYSAYGAVSYQIAALRSYFATAATSADPLYLPFKAALNRTIPVIVYANQVDEINALVRLKKEIGFDLVILGGAEAHLIGDYLAAEGVGVILNPPRQQPAAFETWNALGPQGVHKLVAAGVKVGLGLDENDMVRTLRWEAGIAQAGGGAAGRGLSFTEALATVTKNVAQLLKVSSLVGSLRIGANANFGLFSANPLGLASEVLLVGVKDHIVCNPTQF